MKKEDLPKDIQEILNDTSVQGQTLQDVIKDCENSIKSIIHFPREYKPRGYFRQPFTAIDQMKLYKKSKIVYVTNENLLFWAESNLIGLVIDYDKPEKIMDSVNVMPLSICGIDGNEFDGEQQVVYTIHTDVRVINQDVVYTLQGNLE
tara:strand:+ start:3341 stop:3784 length:444 start_codon:yes stop_codon:yes gene_type:complete